MLPAYRGDILQKSELNTSKTMIDEEKIAAKGPTLTDFCILE
jgi:hypothetical protein